MIAPRILLLGKNGQLGWHLQHSLGAFGDVTALDRTQCDLANPDAIARIVAAHAPHIVINAAAYTAVDRAEQEAELCHRINADAVAAIARACATSGAYLIHYSTDYVFDGAKPAPYEESDAPNPVNVYGASKLAGECAIEASGARAVILRVSWIYGPHGANFPKTMLRLARERDELRIVADQTGAPASVRLIGELTQALIARAQAGAAITGLYHLAPAGETSWHGFASAVLAEARARGYDMRVAPDRITPIATADYPTPALRPKNSRLATNKLQQALPWTPPQWQTDISWFLDELSKLS